ncbi:hypothetical protein Syun_001359 [Stephania yunnanensis]|uniref:Myosin motor domain-containing protein n=1 Tax=Stephania yunnanensis TaxID=152371 RepID=A0AAP0LJ87_9MAGN
MRKPDITKAKELLNWEPKITLRVGLPRMVTDFQKRIEEAKRLIHIKVHSTSGEDARVMLSDGKVLTMPKGTVLPVNPNILEDTDDLVQLSFLNEPSVLHNLCCSYSQSKSYTKVGSILLAMNPFKGAEVCGNELVSGCGKKLKVSPGPHDEKIKLLILQQGSCVQIFSHFDVILNGKLIDIHFKPTGKVFRGKIRTCIHLDFKMRVIQLAKGERSFHVFYQLCSGAPSFLKAQASQEEVNQMWIQLFFDRSLLARVPDSIVLRSITRPCSREG